MKSGSLFNGKKPTLLSLFDGSGGFPLAGVMCGITPTYASEVEPYPIAVTTSRFPNMKHLGSVTDIKGAEIEPVDIITFGSPCQDLSVAGKRAGLKHEANGDEETTRSGLFMEAVRIIKEMRGKTNGLYPNFAIWENVPGAFSSNGGEDFRVVLEELIKICEPGASVPSPEKGRWPYSDAYVGDGWSLAYRTLDAQYWGVPQRRRRIYLVLDLRGERAHKVLFEREGLRGYFETGRAPWQRTAGNAENCLATADSEREGDCVGFMRQLSGVEAKDEQSPTILAAAGESGNNQPCVAYTMKIRSGCEGGGKGALVQEDKSATLATNNDQYLFQPTVCIKEQNLFEIHSQDARYKGPLEVCPMLPAQLGTGGNNQPFVVENQPCVYDGSNVTSPINASNPQPGDPCHTLSTDSRNILVEPVYCLQGNGIDRADTAGCNGKGWNDKTCYTLNTIDRPAVAFGVIPASFYPQMKAESQCFRTDGVANTIVNGTNPGFQNGVVQPICVADHPTPKIDETGVAYRLNARDYKAPLCTAYLASSKETVGTLMASMATKQCLGDQEAFSGDYHIIEEHPVAIDRAAFNQGQNAQYDPQYYTDGTVPTLVARGPGAVAHKQEIHYIVRRLTPTECARLQGFPDLWGHPDHKEDFTDEEYNFWLEVRNTHATINGKTTKEYTKEQMLTWYNKLHTDSAEYKMWGNGIALPTAMYVMQGIADALKADEPQPITTDETEATNTKEHLNTIQKRENLNHIYRTGKRGPGGAYHDYTIVRADTQEILEHIEFQKGPRNDLDARHGVLDCDLLEIVRDRLKAFQEGPYACYENARALMYLEQALIQMNLRVEDRIARRVLGTMDK